MDFLLKLFEDDEKAANTTNKQSNTGRSGQTQRENKKTVGLQVRAYRGGGGGHMTFSGM